MAIDEASLRLLLAFFITAGVAILIYSTQIPESIFPGRFDVWFHSHQIFHVLAVTAGVIQLDAIKQLQLFGNRPCDI